MKSFALLIAAVSIVTAQSLADLPPCGQICVRNMIGKGSSEFGCDANDARCFCTNVNFGYGIRDCSIQSCPNEGAAAAAISYGAVYCASVLAGSSVSIPTVPSTPGSATGTAGSGASSIAVTTVPLVATSTGPSTTFVTTTGSTTIYTATNGAVSVISSLASDAASYSSALNSASSILGSFTSALGSAASSAVNGQTTSSSTGGAPINTAAPMLMGAGLVALLVV